MNKYEWRMRSFAKGIDPDEAVRELERIENLYGSLTPENILKESVTTEAILHSLFEWDDSKAAELHRLQQARVILNNINIKIIQNGQSRSIPVFEVVSVGESRCYKSIESMTAFDIEQVRKATRKELNTLKVKLSFYNEFDSAIHHINNAIESI